MFGYVTINKNSLPEAEYERFRGYYCGLCRRIRLEYGSLRRMTLTYDMTFLYLLLTALYEPETSLVRERCCMEPFRAHAALDNAWAVYAADMNVMLSYFQCEDDVNDDRSPAARIAKAALENAFRKAVARRPREYEAVKSAVGRLTELEKKGDLTPDAPANLMGEMLGTIYAPRDDFFRPLLTRMGCAMGRFVYLTDAYCDMEEDLKKGRRNPFLAMRDRPDFEDYALSVLKMMMADCADAFEQLPVLTDAGLIRNILYSGVWNGYAAARARRDKKSQKDGNA